VTGTLATALSPIEPSITAQTITDGAARTPDGRAYTVAVLRDADYRTVKNAIHDLPGVRFTTSERLLAPDAGFARQVLPAVRTALAAQLDGVPGWSVVAVDAAGGTVATLVEEAPKPGTTAAISLDRAVQTAAEDAVEPIPQQAVLVVVQPSTGQLLAVAQNGAADAAGALALTGRFPPGSTFKIVTGAGRGRAGRALGGHSRGVPGGDRASAADRCRTPSGSTSEPCRCAGRSPVPATRRSPPSVPVWRRTGLTTAALQLGWGPTTPSPR
jgi:hypothetical protein